VADLKTDAARDAMDAGVHYTRTANGRPACEGYDDRPGRDPIPASEAGTDTPSLVTCLWCQEVIEADAWDDDDFDTSLFEKWGRE
jgi:hypothetical protein